MNLGQAKNYKVKVIQDRWQQQREAWLHPKTKKEGDVRDGVPKAHLLKGARRKSLELNNEASINSSRARKVMKS